MKKRTLKRIDDQDTGWSVQWDEDFQGWIVYDQAGEFHRWYMRKADAEAYLDWVCGTYVERFYLTKGA